MKFLKFNEIDFGTKLRTLLGVLVALNQAISLTPIPDFGSEGANIAYKNITVIISIIVLAYNTYMNNDYTEGAAIGTAAGRIYNTDPTTIIDVYDSDEDDDDEDDADVEVNNDEVE